MFQFYFTVILSQDFKLCESLVGLLISWIAQPCITVDVSN